MTSNQLTVSLQKMGVVVQAVISRRVVVPRVTGVGVPREGAAFSAAVPAVAPSQNWNGWVLGEGWHL